MHSCRIESKCCVCVCVCVRVRVRVCVCVFVCIHVRCLSLHLLPTLLHASTCMDSLSVHQYSYVRNLIPSCSCEQVLTPDTSLTLWTPLKCPIVLNITTGVYLVWQLLNVASLQFWRRLIRSCSVLLICIVS